MKLIKNSRFAKLGQFLKEKRVASGYTQKEVAKILGHKTPQFISNIEKGRAGPPEQVLNVLVKLYQINDLNKLVDIIYSSEEAELKLRLKTLKQKLAARR